MEKQNISFKKLSLEDIPLIHKWLNATHVHAWYEKDRENQYEVVEEEYKKYITGEDKMEGYIVFIEDQAIGYIQSYKIWDYPEFGEALGYDKSTAAIDIFIGEVEFTGKGLGSVIIKKFLKEIVFAEEGVTVCLIDPEPENKRAIKSYEKAGFRYVKTLDVPPDPGFTYLMEIKRGGSNNLTSSLAAPAISYEESSTYTTD